MSRARLLKPGFFKNEGLADLRPPEQCTSTPASSYAARLCFEGLWTLADRAGRLEDRPKRIKGEIFPYDEVDVAALLESLDSGGFIRRYVIGHEHYIAIVKFLKHQSPHVREPESIIPAPPKPRPASGQHSARLEPAGAISPVIDPVPVPESVPDPESESESEALSGNGDGVKEKSSVADAPRNPPVEKSSGNVAVITKIAHEAIDLLGPTSEDLPETVKQLCAQRHIAYDGTTVAKALDSARFQRAQHR